MSLFLWQEQGDCSEIVARTLERRNDLRKRVRDIKQAFEHLPISGGLRVFLQRSDPP